MQIAFIVIVSIQAVVSIGAAIYSIVTTKKMKDEALTKLEAETKATMWKVQKHGKKKKK